MRISDKLFIPTLILVLSISMNVRLFYNIESMPSVTVVEIISYSVLLIFLAESALNKSVVGLINKDLFSKNRVLFCYFGWSCLAAFVGLTRSPQALQLYKDVLPALLVFFFVVATVDSEEKLNKLIWVYIAGLTITGLLAFLQVQTNSFYLGGFHEGTQFKTGLEGESVENLAMGIFPHPNGLAMYLIPGYLLLFALLFYRRYDSLGANLFLGALFALLTYDLIHTYAKATYIWIAFGIIMVLLPKRLRGVSFPISVFFLLVGTAGITIYGLHEFSSGNLIWGTLLTRFQLWQAAIAAIQDDVFIQLFGSGYSETFRLSRSFSNIEYTSSHNAILNQVIAFGIPAVMFYVGTVILAIWRVSKMIREGTEKYRALELFLLAAITAYVGESFFEPANEDIVLQSQLFLLFAIAFVLRSFQTNPQKQSGPTEADSRKPLNSTPESLY